MNVADKNIEQTLRKLREGDIVHGTNSNGASLICLVTEIRANALFVRTVTTQIPIEFDIQTGSGRMLDKGGKCSIDSVAPLPTGVHEVIMGIERRFRLVADIEEAKLGEEERRALLFVADFYPKHPLRNENTTQAQS